jgi:GntR family transcriptional regulator, transcriptional repressor for pyruvate dehydrogenase complex
MPEASKPGRKPRSSDLQKLGRIAEELGTVRREGLTEKLVQRLGNLVLRGVLSPGERLPTERDLAIMLSVSRSSLRQALKVLQVMGVLEIRQGSGNYLTRDASEILSVPPQMLVPLRGLSQAELFEVRRAMEAESAATAAQRATKEDLHRIRAAYESMAGSTDRFMFGKHDLAFHQAIAAACGNRFFLWFLASANKFLYQAMIKRPGLDLDRSRVEHERILLAIEARDPEAARQEMLHHVAYSKYQGIFDEKTPSDIRFVAYGTAPAAGETGDGVHALAPR